MGLFTYVKFWENTYILSTPVTQSYVLLSLPACLPLREGLLYQSTLCLRGREEAWKAAHNGSAGRRGGGRIPGEAASLFIVLEAACWALCTYESLTRLYQNYRLWKEEESTCHC